MVYHVGDSIRTRGGEGPLTPGGGARLLNRNQKAVARQLTLVAYLLSSDGRGKDETSILGEPAAVRGGLRHLACTARR